MTEKPEQSDATVRSIFTESQMKERVRGHVLGLLAKLTDQAEELTQSETYMESLRHAAVFSETVNSLAHAYDLLRD